MHVVCFRYAHGGDLLLVNMLCAVSVLSGSSV
jgi:hypothetical protein